MLKLIAFILMTIDHMCWLWPHYIPYEVGFILRLICRLSFPIFAYDCVMGLRRTHSIAKYLARLGLLAVISQYAIHFAYTHWHVRDIADFVNIFFTLFAGIIFIMSLDLIIASYRSLSGKRKTEKWHLFHYGNCRLWQKLTAPTENRYVAFICLLLGLVLAICCLLLVYIFKTDYAVFGLLFIATLHFIVYKCGDFNPKLDKTALQNLIPVYLLRLACVIGVYLLLADYLLPWFGINSLMFGDVQTFVIFIPYLLPLAAKSHRPKWWVSRLLYFYYPLHLLLICYIQYLTIR